LFRCYSNPGFLVLVALLFDFAICAPVQPARLCPIVRCAAWAGGARLSHFGVTERYTRSQSVRAA